MTDVDGSPDILLRRLMDNSTSAFAVTSGDDHVLEYANAEGIFEPFGQVNPSLTKPNTGIGLGLSISVSSRAGWAVMSL